VAALSVCGFLCPEFVFMGFLPSGSGSARKEKLRALAEERRICVIYESPRRVVRTLQELVGVKASAAQRRVLCARELTKLHEELFRGTVAEAIQRLGGGGQGGDDQGQGQSASAPKGEFTLVLDAWEDEPESPDESREKARGLLRGLMEGGGSLSDAVKQVTKSVALRKPEVYQLALQIQKEKGGGLEADKPPSRPPPPSQGPPA
jgi:16S rRNA (cytidine1402-2'-O)-methyltransferase